MHIEIKNFKIHAKNPVSPLIAALSGCRLFLDQLSEQNLLVDDAGSPVRHPQIPEFFETYDPDKHAYLPRLNAAH